MYALLGNVSFKPGTHFCIFYNYEREKYRYLQKLLVDSVRMRKRLLYLGKELTTAEDFLEVFFPEEAVPNLCKFFKYIYAGESDLRTSAEEYIYFQDFNTLRKLIGQSLGKEAITIAWEVDSRYLEKEFLSHLLELEAEINAAVRGSNVSVACLYQVQNKRARNYLALCHPVHISNYRVIIPEYYTLAWLKGLPAEVIV